MFLTTHFHTLALTMLCSLLAFGLLGTTANAHSEGASFERTIDGYLIDIGYSPEEPQAGEQTRFDFFLYDAETDTEIPFTDIWFRIEEGNRLLLAGGLAKAQFGATGITYAFPTEGTYTGFVRFSNEGETIVEAEFELSVKPGDGTDESAAWSDMLIGLIVGLLLGGAGVYIYERRRQGASETLRASEATVESESGTRYGTLIPSIVIGLACAAGAFYITNALLADQEPQSTDVESATAQPVDSTGGPVEIVLTPEGYEPSELTIKQGTTVTFSTTANRPHWPASNLHPTHGIYSEFDSKEAVPADESWSFAFDRVGSWNMHDHLRSYFTGTIHVVE